MAGLHCPLLSSFGQGPAVTIALPLLAATNAHSLPIAPVTALNPTGTNECKTVQSEEFDTSILVGNGVPESHGEGNERSSFSNPVG